jgi:hypothetical protein
MGLWNGESPDLVGRLVRIMGYGRLNPQGVESDASSGAGTLRSGDVRYTESRTAYLRAAVAGNEPSTLPGDSGGPTYSLSDRFGRSLLGQAGWHIANEVNDGSIAAFRNWIHRTITGPGSVSGNLRPDVMLVGGSGWNTIYWASSQGASGVFTANAAPAIDCSIMCTPPPVITCPQTCSPSVESNFATAAQQSGVRPVSGDFNGDRRLDVVLVGGAGTTLPILTAISDTRFSAGTVSPQNGFAALARTSGARPVAGDFDGDGRTDIALTAGSGWTGIPVAMSGGYGAVTNIDIADFPTWSRSGAQTVSGDFDGDGRDDLALVGGPGWGSIPIALSNGDGSFMLRNEGVANIPQWAQTSGVKVVAGDYNGDGRDDIALTGGTGWGSVPVAFSIGDGRFWVTNEPVVDIPSWAQTSGVRAVAADFDADGREDIALVGGAGWGTIPVAFSVGDGTFRRSNGGAGNIPTQAQNANASVLAIRGGGSKRAVHPVVEIAAARNTDGRLEVFSIGTDTLIYRNKQLAANGGWSGEIHQGGAAKKMVLAENQDGRLELFYVGTNDRVYHRWQTAPGGPWVDTDVQMGGSTAKEIAVGRNSDGRLEIFYTRLGDDWIFHNYQVAPNGAWSGELSMDGQAKRVAVETGTGDMLNLVVIGTDDAIWHRPQLATGGWGGWNPLGGNAKELAVGRNFDGRVYAFYITGNLAPSGPNRIRINYQLPGPVWSGDSPFSSNSMRALKIATARTVDARMELLVAGAEISINVLEYYQPAANGSFTGPSQALGTQAVKGFAVAPPTASGPLEVFYIGHENVLRTDVPGSGPGARTAIRTVGDERGIAEARICIMTDEYQSTTVSCPAGQLIAQVPFASYGTPGGTCGVIDNAFTQSSCHASVSKAVVEAACVGKPSCTIDVNNGTFGPGDPCVNVVKRLYAFLRCV